MFGGDERLGTFFFVFAAASEGAVAEETAAFLLDGLVRACGLGSLASVLFEGRDVTACWLYAGHGGWVGIVALGVTTTWSEWAARR